MQIDRRIALALAAAGLGLVVLLSGCGGKTAGEKGAGNASTAVNSGAGGAAGTAAETPGTEPKRLSEAENLRLAKVGEPMSTGVPGCRCHAKSQGLRTMHKRFNMMQCARCHLGNPMAKKNGKIDMKAALARRLKDDRCAECHAAKTASASPGNSRGVAGKRFCIRCQKAYASDYRYCPKDGTQLVDVDKLTIAAMKGKSNAVCVVCHTPDSRCIIKHPKRAVGADPKDCLKCHKNHWDCRGCHH